ncbi:MAG: DUF927 domain-containing protein [Candidatus Limnocylindrus sp.]
MIDTAEQAAASGRASDVVAAIRAALLDPTQLDALLDLDPVELDRRLRALALVRGAGQAVSHLRRALDDRLSSRTEADPTPSSATAAQSLSAILTRAGLRGVDDAPLCELPVPSGYAVGDGQIWRVGGETPTCVARSLIAVVGRVVDVDRERVSLSLAWHYAGAWRTQTVPREAVADGRALLASTASHGAPIDGSSARHVAAWLIAQEQAAPALTETRSQGYLGWTPDGDGFGLSSTHYGAPVQVIAPGPGEEGASYGDAAGTLDQWTRTVWVPMSRHPGGAAILASLAAPLLRVVGAVHGFTFELACESGRGKSTSGDAAASVWGPPGPVVQRWPTTKAGARESLTFRRGVPTFWDEAQDVRRTPDLVSTALYLVGGEHGQTLGYGGSDGGTRAVRRIETILISTAEAPAADKCQDAPGALARLISLRADPIPPGHRAFVTTMAASCRATYGTAGPALVAWLCAHRDRWPAIRASYAAHVDRLQREAPDDQTARVGAYVALLHVAAEVAIEARVLGHVPPALFASVGAAVEGAAAERDVPLSALRAAYDWWIARKPQSAETVAHGVRIGWDDGRITQDHGVHIAWLSGSLREALTSCGYAPDAMIRSWGSRGWLVSHEGRTTARIASVVDQSRPRAVIWSSSAMAAIHDEPTHPRELF